MVRNINVIAREVLADWKKPSPYALPYIKAMLALQSIDDKYLFEDGRSVVLYFLSNAGSWRGDTARRVKAELNAALKA